MFGDAKLKVFPYVLINTFVMLAVLLGVFIGLNWDHMPNGLAGFLEIRVRVKNLIVFGLFILACVVAFRVLGLSEPSLSGRRWKGLAQIAKACTLASVFALIFPLTSQSRAFTDRILIYFLPTSILACGCGWLVTVVFENRVASAFARRQDLIIVGTGPRAFRLSEHLREPHHGNPRILGFVDSPNGHPVHPEIRQRMLGGLDELEGILMKRPVDEVLIALPTRSCYREIQAAIKTCERAGVEAKYLSDVFEVSLAKLAFEPDDSTPVISLKVVKDDYRLLVKRATDIIGAIVALILFGPLMLTIAAAIRLADHGPALFTQERYGLHKRRFRMYKFRTMVPDAEQRQSDLESSNQARGPVFKIRNDPRVTPFGRFLRKTSIDELPQLFNVLMGQMAMVGPRPLPKRDVHRFDDASMMRRFSVKPGMTGLWQIDGRSNTDFGRWLALDLQYIDTWSLSLDFWILVRTVPAVVCGTGAA